MNNVLRDVPYRHWVLCLPAELRYNIGRYPALITRVLKCFLRSIFSLLCAKALRRDPTLLPAMLHPAALSVRHRVSADLTANIHFHCLVPEGVYVERTRGGAVYFLKVRPPTTEEIAAVAADTCRRTRRLLMAKGYWTDLPDRRGSDAVRGVLSLRDARPVTFYGRAVGRNDDSPRRAGADAFDVFAASRVEQGDRAGLENLVRYLLAPPFTADQLTVDANGDLILRFKRPRHNGTTERRLTFHQFIEAVVGLIPQPRSHGIGYHGALARNARIRKFIVARQRPRTSAQIIGHANELETAVERNAWRQLHVRAHRPDFLTCRECYGRFLLVSLVGPNLHYRSPRWVAPDTPARPAAAPVSTPQQGMSQPTSDSR